MAADEPAFLSKGVEVSAKYRGAFCEAKVIGVEKSVKCRVVLKEDGKHMIVSDEDLKGVLKIGGTVEVQKPDSGRYVEATLTRVTDHSLYTVIFDDGDEETLRRSKLCLKGSRHFMKSETLDDLPLTNPEHFSTPVIRKTSKKHSKNAGGTDAESYSDDDDDDDSLSSCGSSDMDSDRASLSKSAKETAARIYSKCFQDLVGQVLCVDVDDRTKKLTLPVIVVLPIADEQTQLSADQFLVKSFKDNKFFPMTLETARLFSPAMAGARANACKDKAAKFAWDKAQLYLDQQELPQNWDTVELLGTADLADSDELSDGEVIVDERRDRFVAQLYKFMDDRGTPLNKAPTIAGVDIDLFNLFRLVTSMGGYNRVNNMGRWATVYMRMKIPTPLTLNVALKQMKEIYERYLHAYEDFNRKLGCTMVPTSTRPERGRHPSSRSLLSFRDRGDTSVKSVGKLRRPSACKDDPSTPSTPKMPTLDKEIKEEPPEPDEPTKLESAVRKTETTSLRSTRKTPKRLPGDSVKPLLTESKSSEDLTNLRSRSPTESKDIVDETGKKPVDVTDKVTRHRRAESARVTRADAVKTKLDNTSGFAVKKTDTTDDKVDKKQIAKVQTSLKDEKSAKKRPADGGDEKKSASIGRSEGKRTLNLMVEKMESTKDDKPSKLAKRIPRKLGTIDGNKLSAADDTASSNNDYESGSTDKDDDRAISVKPNNNSDVLTIGTRLRVRYGKGPTQKIYEAKVLEVERRSGGVIEYRVHYAGWNTRYDEWIKRDAVVSVIEDVSDPAPLPPASTPSTAVKQKTATPVSVFAQMKKKRIASSDASLANPVRRQKRMASTESSRSSTRERVGKIPRRRTRTRSTTERATSPNEQSRTAGDSSTVSSSSSSSSSDSASEADDADIPVTTSSPPVPVLTKQTVDPPDSFKPVDESGTGEQPAQDEEVGPTLVSEVQTEKQRQEDSVESVVADETKTTLQKDENSKDAEDVGEPSVVAACVSTVEPTDQLPEDAPPEMLPKVDEEEAKEESGADEDEPSIKTRGKSRSVTKNTMPCLVAEPLEPSVPVVDEPAAESKSEMGASKTKTVASSDEKIKARVKKKGGTDDETSEQSEKKAKGVGKKKTKEEECEEKEDSKNDVLVKDVSSKPKDDVGKRKTGGNKGKAVDVKEDDGNLENMTEDEKDKESSKMASESKTSKSSSKKPCQSTVVDTAAKEKRTRRVSEKSAVDSGDDPVLSKGKRRGKASKTETKVDTTQSQDSVLCETESSQDSQVAFKEAEHCTESAVKLRLQTEPEMTEEMPALSASSKPPELSLPPAAVGEEPAEKNVTKCSDDKPPSSDQSCETVKVPDIASEVCEEKDVIKTQEAEPVVEETASQEYSSNSDDDICHLGISPGGSICASSLSPPGPGEADEEHTSTKSELEANMEVAAYMGVESNNGELSSDDDDEDDDDDDDSGAVLNVTTSVPKHSTKGSSGVSVPRKRKSDLIASHRTSTGKRHKREKHAHRTRSQHRLAAANRSYCYSNDASDSDDAEMLSPDKRSTETVCSAPKLHSSRSIKYNFLDLKEGRMLEGEDRIAFLMSKIQDLRHVYMQLKAEVACIDRRRRRHRIKERDAQQQSGIALSSITAVTTS